MNKYVHTFDAEPCIGRLKDSTYFCLLTKSPSVYRRMLQRLYKFKIALFSCKPTANFSKKGSPHLLGFELTKLNLGTKS